MRGSLPSLTRSGSNQTAFRTQFRPRCQPGQMEVFYRPDGGRTYKKAWQKSSPERLHALSLEKSIGQSGMAAALMGKRNAVGS